jgi:glycosyltransferase involved in cell wall biosynthesis
MSRLLHLGILATHPIQYFAPLYRELAASRHVRMTVYFAHRPTAIEQGAGFGVPFQWDIDLTGGFDHRFLTNVAPRPDLQTYTGCDTPEIAGIIARERFDVFLVSGWNTRSYRQAMRACWREGIPVMVRGDSQLVGPRNVAKALLKRIVYPRFMRRFAACLAVGTRSAEYFAHYGARRIVSSPHFVDNATFASRAKALRQDRTTLRRQWGIPDDAFVPLFAAKFVEKKRPADFVRAVAAAGEGVHGLMVGDGELRTSMEELASTVDARIAFTGFLNQTEIVRAFVAADVLVLPSDWRETWGLVVNEAMAAGLPAIVSTEAGCAPDLVLPGETGMRFDRGDVPQLTTHLGSLAHDRASARRMGVRASAHVARYSVTAAAAGVLEAARQVWEAR